ncbi:hypothetical protein ymoll0001_24880 [Yersinia mollaretii ATCC 43969]|uniref:IlvB operon leader peptide IvbL n=1 Tax=Yersinia mollaretii (strain ATCC 43969 / DSM 18520 / CIP 103324 / CNY 7263 / WAIP 204) TaxID=349967 RepID=A0ABM9YDN5_YERMW|nr:hypothetical protein ymoll0001_24880 [Yersinia mollaretii ATCC 43969]
MRRAVAAPACRIPLLGDMMKVIAVVQATAVLKVITAVLKVIIVLKVIVV